MSSDCDDRSGLSPAIHRKTYARAADAGPTRGGKTLSANDLANHFNASLTNSAQRDPKPAATAPAVGSRDRAQQNPGTATRVLLRLVPPLPHRDDATGIQLRLRVHTFQEPMQSFRILPIAANERSWRSSMVHPTEGEQ